MFFGFEKKTPGGGKIPTVRLPFQPNLPVMPVQLEAELSGKMPRRASKVLTLPTPYLFSESSTSSRPSQVRSIKLQLGNASVLETPFLTPHDEDAPRCYLSFDLFIALILLRIARGHRTNRK